MGTEAFPQTCSLRDGSTVVIELFGSQDAEALKAFYRALPEEDRLVLKEDVTTEEWAKRFQAKAGRGEMVSLVAKEGDKVVAEGTLYRALHGWTRHVGELRLNVAPSHRRKGLGTALAGALVKVATGMGMEKLVVQMVETQPGTRRTFEKLGFAREAILRGQVKDISGMKRDLQVWSNDVSQIWNAMEAMMADYNPSHE